MKRSWLEQLDLIEFTESVPRPRSADAAPGRCGALPARAFQGRYGHGCLRRAAHEGAHAPEPRSAERADAAADRRSARPA